MKLGAVRFVISTALIVGSLAVTPANAVSAANVRPIPAPRIFGGTEVSGSKAPWIVKIVTVDSKKPVVAGKWLDLMSSSSASRSSSVRRMGTQLKLEASPPFL